MKWRTGFIFWLLIIVFVAVMIRIGTLSMNSRILSVGYSQGSKTLTVATVRGTIYDRKGRNLVNNEYGYVAALMPEQDLLATIKTAVLRDTYRLLLEKAKERLPLSVKLNRSIAETDGLCVFRVPVRYTSTDCTHLIGYLNGSGQGVSGIEKAFESTLSENTGKLTATFPINGAGDRLETGKVEVQDTTANSRGGVMLTIDKDVQQVIDEIADNTIAKGAVVVLNASGDLLALSSRPDFDPQKPETALNSTESPLINRGLSKYDCGSVFKIVTAAAALEYGISENQGYLCEGNLTVENTTFHCHNRQGHSLVNMEQAFAQSCNLYFIQLAQEIGAERLLKMAEKLGLYDTITLADGLVSAPATLPTEYELQTPAALANLSFGQGELLVSPLHIARMTATLTANGTLPQIRAVIGTISKEGTLTEIESREGETVLSAANTRKLCQMMEQVVLTGTGTAANPLYTTAAGKTGTAETGQLDENGVPITQSWFSGYFPADNPGYVITVLVEDAGNSDNTAAEVFCEISNKLEQKRRNGE